MGVRKTGYESKKRNSNSRIRKRIIVISAEGKNKTETNYFRKFNSDKVKIHFAPGNATDPVKMVEELLQECEEKDIKRDSGDRAFCLVDSDVNAQKNKQIMVADKIAATNKEYGMEVIVSAPCFEEWFICHYIYSTKQYNSNEELLEAVEKIIPEYSKGREDLYELLADYQEQAIQNAKRLEKHCVDSGRKIHTADFQPSTEVYKIIEAIRAIEYG
ncbi:RloB family protein [Anaerovibrio sp. JC8]|uniref:RloB family protein n=1 Tax=Anaerovibrio sp. JC8 TaxID=1240085 RepID=UPI000A11DEB0|nr:RloB family protein [Anaerovibrio sp. JC8]